MPVFRRAGSRVPRAADIILRPLRSARQKLQKPVEVQGAQKRKRPEARSSPAKVRRLQGQASIQDFFEEQAPPEQPGSGLQRDRSSSHTNTGVQDNRIVFKSSS